MTATEDTPPDTQPKTQARCRHCDATMTVEYVGIRDIAFHALDGSLTCDLETPCIFERENRALASMGLEWDYRITQAHQQLCACDDGFNLPHLGEVIPDNGPPPPEHCAWPMQYRGTHYQCRQCPEVEAGTASSSSTRAVAQPVSRTTRSLGNAATPRSHLGGVVAVDRDQPGRIPPITPPFRKEQREDAAERSGNAGDTAARRRSRPRRETARHPNGPAVAVAPRRRAVHAHRLSACATGDPHKARAVPAVHLYAPVDPVPRR